MDATYDGIKAFQINASYNSLSNVSDTLREDVEAAISTFMQSLSMNMGLGGYNKKYMTDYIPAVLFTLYDGYYIYSPERTENGYEYMLKPYNFYTVRYKMNESNDVVINYTLDNYIVVYGWIGGKYYVKSGYLVSNKRSVNDETISENVPYKSTTGTEILIGVRPVTDDYYDPEYTNKLEEGVSDERDHYLYPRNSNYYIDPASASKYYSDAEEFSNWVTDKLSWVTADMAMRNNKKLEEFNGDNTRVFNINTTDNDPEDLTSIFTQHKTNVIKYSIQDNLNQAITAYSQGSTSTYDFKLPKLDINEWDMVSSNICMLTFMQGVPMGTKYYNNYALVQSTSNSLYVSQDDLYFIADGGDGYYHKIDCPNLTGSNITGYSNFDFLLKKLSLKDETSYYKHDELACYYCIVDSNYESVNWRNDATKSTAYYTALAREKYRRYTTTGHLDYEEE